MPFADVNGQRLFFEDSGGDGPAVLLSHGFLMDSTMFDPQVEALAPEFRCIRWDERAFGRTEFDGKPFTYWDSAADVQVQLLHGPVGQSDDIDHFAVVAMEPGDKGFTGTFRCEHPGRYGFTVRVVPDHPDLVSPVELGLVAWG
jgi:hypothetical protein